MVNILLTIVITAVIAVVGGGMAYPVWLKTRPKKETWNAKVYQLGQGVREPVKKNGKIVSKLRIADLKPYATDTLEKIEKKDGTTIYRLKKLNKVTPAVEGDIVDYWGKDNKEVSVLMTNSGCTLLKRGYDKSSGEMLFDPIPHSRINLIKGELAVRKERYQQEKDILQAITPWIVAGMTMLALVAISYIMISGFIEIAEKTGEALEENTALEKQNIDLQKRIQEMKQGITPEPNPVGSSNTSVTT